MRVCVILNPKAGSAGAADALLEAVRAEQASGAASFAVRETARSGHALELAAEAVAEGFGLVVAAGGDGTVNEVVNGLAPSPRPAALAVVPLGTGNDLARTLALPEEPGAALERAVRGARRRIDLIRVTSSDGTVYAINACAGGFTGEVNEAMTGGLKRTWGPLAYLIGAARALPDLADYGTRLAWDGGPLEPAEAFNIVVANGRTAAGGRAVAPQANPEDGLLDVAVVRGGSALEMAGLAADFLAGTYLENEHVLFRRARRLRVEARPGMWFSVDGELLASAPATFEVVPRALEVVVGPDYEAQPSGAS